MGDGGAFCVLLQYVIVYNDSGMKHPLSSLLSDTDFIILLKSGKSRRSCVSILYIYIFDVHTRKVS